MDVAEAARGRVFRQQLDHAVENIAAVDRGVGKAFGEGQGDEADAGADIDHRAVRWRVQFIPDLVRVEILQPVGAAQPLDAGGVHAKSVGHVRSLIGKTAMQVRDLFRCEIPRLVLMQQ